MYAIFMTGGKQYKVSAGDVLRIEKIQGDVGDKVTFDNVIAFSDADGSLKTGTPYLDATVNATITDAGRGAKVIIFKFKAKKNYRRKQGHRQPYTEVEVDNFTIDGKDFGEKPEKPEPVVEEAPEEEAAEVPAKKETRKAKPKKAEAKKAQEEEPEVPEEEPEKLDTKAAPKKAAGTKSKKAEKTEEPKEEAAEEKPAKTAKEEKTPKEDKPAKAAKAVKAADEEKAPKEDKPAKAVKAQKAESKTEEADTSKMTKADITAKLDELGITYLKSAKKDDLLAQLKEAEGK